MSRRDRKGKCVKQKNIGKDDALKVEEKSVLRRRGNIMLQKDWLG